MIYQETVKKLRKDIAVMTKILFVCHGNICRSPMAEFVCKDLASTLGKAEELLIASCATSTEEIGNPVHYQTRNLLNRYGINTDGKYAVQLKKTDYAKYDYILAMDQNNLRNIQRILVSDPDHKVSRLLDYTEHPRDIADPWYTGDFETTYQDILEGCHAFLNHIYPGTEEQLKK